MKNFTIYLAGSVHQTWYRNYCLINYSKYFKLLDPLHQERAEEVHKSDNPNKRIIEIDKREMYKSNLVVAYIDYPSYGTVMEICYSKDVLGIPVYLINPNKKEFRDPWLEQYCDKIFFSIDKCFETLLREVYRMTYHGYTKKYDENFDNMSNNTTVADVGPGTMQEGSCSNCENVKSCNKEEYKEESNLNMGQNANKGMEDLEPLDGNGKFNQISDGRYGLEDDQVATKLLDKQYSPMIVRKYTRVGFPIFVHLICDANLEDLDDEVHKCIDYCQDNGILINNIQSLRNFTGIMSEWLDNHYNSKKKGCVESIGIIMYADKQILSALKGDAMNCFLCRQELYYSIQLMTQM